MKQTAYPYYRVSTKRQGHSGLGLSAQRQAVEAYAHFQGLKLGKAYIEIESGRKKRRPILERALESCKANKAVLLIARLDRLSRNVAFTSALIESGIEFKAVDNPQADKFTIHILAAVAQKEAEDTSKRTKDALQIAKHRGVILGSNGTNVLARQNHEASKKFALKHRLLFYRLQQNGFITIRQITEELNRLGVPTFRQNGHRWHLATVHKIMQHYQKLKNHRK